MLLTKFNYQLFSILARQHYYLYFYSGVVLGFLTSYFIEPNQQIVFLREYENSVIITLMVPVVAYFIFMFLFYRDGELGEQILTTAHGFIKKDLYFAVAIERETQMIRKIIGCTYVVLRVLHSEIHGFVLGFTINWILLSTLKAIDYGGYYNSMGFFEKESIVSECLILCVFPV